MLISYNSGRFFFGDFFFSNNVCFMAVDIVMQYYVPVVLELEAEKNTL